MAITGTKPTTSMRWADVGGSKVDPPSGKRDTGWISAEQPPAEYFNYIDNAAYNWQQYLESITDQVISQALVRDGTTTVTGTLSSSASGVANLGNTGTGRWGSVNSTTLNVSSTSTLTGVVTATGGVTTSSGSYTTTGTGGVNVSGTGGVTVASGTFTANRSGGTAFAAPNGGDVVIGGGGNITVNTGNISTAGNLMAKQATSFWGRFTLSGGTLTSNYQVGDGTARTLVLTRTTDTVTFTFSPALPSANVIVMGTGLSTAGGGTNVTLSMFSAPGAATFTTQIAAGATTQTLSTFVGSINYVVYSS